MRSHIKQPHSVWTIQYSEVGDMHGQYGLSCDSHSLHLRINYADLAVCSPSPGSRQLLAYILLTYDMN
jgi:hypothetical protein